MINAEVSDKQVSQVSTAAPRWNKQDCAVLKELSRPSYYSKVLDKHERMKLVIAHMGGKFREEMFPLLAEYQNAFTDCSALQGWLPSNPDMVVSRLKDAAERIPDRIFFGTDWPLFELAYSQPYFIELVRTQPWGSEEMKERLFSGNFQHMMRM